jgi:hypothetical protein
VHQRFIDFKKVNDSVRSVVLCKIFIAFGIPMKLVTLINTHLNKAYSRGRIGKYLSDMLLIRNVLKQVDALLLYRHCFLTLL